MEAGGAGAAGVADSKRNFVYGLHAVNAVLERAPERLLELWIAQPRDDVRTRELRDRAQALGVRVQSAGGEALPNSWGTWRTRGPWRRCGRSTPGMSTISSKH